MLQLTLSLVCMGKNNRTTPQLHWLQTHELSKPTTLNSRKTFQFRLNILHNTALLSGLVRIPPQDRRHSHYQHHCRSQRQPRFSFFWPFWKQISVEGCRTKRCFRWLVAVLPAVIFSPAVNWLKQSDPLIYIILVWNLKNTNVKYII